MESKVVYHEGPGTEVRAVRGIVAVDGQFVKVTRRDKTILIPIHNIVAVETAAGADAEEEVGS